MASLMKECFSSGGKVQKGDISRSKRSQILIIIVIGIIFMHEKSPSINMRWGGGGNLDNREIYQTSSQSQDSKEIRRLLTHSLW